MPADAERYDHFLQTKATAISPVGVYASDEQINPLLFPFQRDAVRWALRKGRAAVFLDTGLGKTFIQLEWARLLDQLTLIVAPLSVARQSVREARKIAVDLRYVRKQSDITDNHNLWITNYDMLAAFDLSRFGAVVLDESSILKALDGKTRRKLISACKDIPYRLACTATPAPNDNIEIGSHAEFLGVCTQAEMLAMFFINANKEHTFFIDGKAYRKKGSNKGGQEWRLKHHAEQPFFRWLASWAIMMTKPSDLGYDDDGFILPPLTTRPHFVGVEYVPDGQLLFTGLKGVGDRAAVRRSTIKDRIDALRDVVTPNEQWVIWCGLDAEQRAVEELLQDECVSVYGSLSPEEKERRIETWLAGGARYLVSKPRICGFGLNLQQAARMAFFGLNDSWEMWYQCIRRQWRYGQTQPVEVHVVVSDVESEVYQNILRKDALATRLRQGLIEQIRTWEKGELDMSEPARSSYQVKQERGAAWQASLGDSAEVLRDLPDNYCDLSCYSPPFADLYTYTDSERDLGNSRNSAEFFQHYGFIIREVLRITKPGRISCVHTSDIPAMAQRDGYIGIKDFPGEVIRAHEAAGWTFIGRAFVQKNPQAQAIRTKSKALLFVQLRKDSSDSRPALVDQVLLFRKPGDNMVPVRPVDNGEMDNETWIEWAHGIWVGIRETDTLQYSAARDGDDEKHICPLQLGTIERCVKLYSNPGELVCSPFMGIGSEGYVAVKLRRRFVGIELKESYWQVAVGNLRRAEQESQDRTLFSV